MSAVLLVAFGGQGALLSLATPVEASYGLGGYHASQARQAYWRPNSQVARVNQYRWRPVDVEVRRAAPTRWQNQSAGSTQRWARNARPVTRARDFASQFRPDHRFEDPPQSARGTVLPSQNSDLHAQFRPLQEPRRMTYEQMYGGQEMAPQPQFQTQPQTLMPSCPIQ